MKTFFDSVACRSRLFCHICRQQSERGRRWRALQCAAYGDPTDINFACPFGIPPNAPPQTPSTTTKRTPARQITAKKVASFLEAMLLSPRVSPEVEAARLAICAQCDRRRVPTNGDPPYCGECDCKVSDEGWRLTNLAAYAENLPKWGCKHPLRGYTDPTGKKLGWPLNTEP